MCMLFHEVFRCITYSSFVQKLASAPSELALIVFHTHGPTIDIKLVLFTAKAVSYRASMKLVIVGKEPLTSNEGLLSPCNVCMVIQVQSRKTQGKLKLVH